MLKKVTQFCWKRLTDLTLSHFFSYIDLRYRRAHSTLSCFQSHYLIKQIKKTFLGHLLKNNIVRHESQKSTSTQMQSNKSSKQALALWGLLCALPVIVHLFRLPTHPGLYGEHFVVVVVFLTLNAGFAFLSFLYHTAWFLYMWLKIMMVEFINVVSCTCHSFVVNNLEQPCPTEIASDPHILI